MLTLLLTAFSDCCFLSYSHSEMDLHIQFLNQSSPTWSTPSVLPWIQKKWRSSGGSELVAMTTLSEVHAHTQPAGTECAPLNSYRYMGYKVLLLGSHIICSAVLQFMCVRMIVCFPYAPNISVTCIYIPLLVIKL